MLLSLTKCIVNAAADLLFPRSCVHCADAVDRSDYDFLCRSCAREIFFSDPPACSTCGYPFFGQVAGPKVCPHCVELVPVFDQGKTLFLAKGPARSLLHELKYRRGFYVLNDLAQMVTHAPHYRKYLAGAQLVPVPLHPDKERERGFNQSRKIAEMLASNCDATLCDQLTRVSFTQTQTQLDRKSRQQNVKNAFALAPNADVISDQQYILIDDVFTTGSTLNACASVLRQAGARKIKVATIGHG